VEVTLTVADLTRLAALIHKAGGIDQLQRHLGLLAGCEEDGEPARTVPPSPAADAVDVITR
jgi:hypothetical protein